MTVTYAKLGEYGRAGNAIWEAAATIGYAKKYNVPYIFPKWQYQNDFNIPQECFVNKKYLKYNSTYQEKSYAYSEIPFSENLNLFGYFQSWKYFDHCKDYIREVFTPKDFEDSSLFRGLCGIHVRRGDYLKFRKFHPVQGMDYYKKAMEIVPSKRFVVFSDDVKWCKQNFIGDKFIVSEEAPTMVDFRMMIACEHLIIGNSSFSWWAAWLNDNEDKVVVCPKKWFGPKLSGNSTKDLIPPEWVTV